MAYQQVYTIQEQNNILREGGEQAVTRLWRAYERQINNFVVNIMLLHGQKLEKGKIEDCQSAVKVKVCEIIQKKPLLTSDFMAYIQDAVIHTVENELFGQDYIVHGEKKTKEANIDNASKDKKSIRQLRVILIIELILVLILSVALLRWTGNVEKRGVLFDFVAEQMFDIASIIVELTVSVVMGVQVMSGKKKFAYVTGCLAIAFIFYGLIASYFKVYGAIQKDIEQIEAEEIISYPTEDAIVIYQLSGYVLEEDIFVEDLELYYVVAENSISQTDRARKIADLVKGEVQNVPLESIVEHIPKTYENNNLTAAFLYQAYRFRKEEAEKQESATVQAYVQLEHLCIFAKAEVYRVEADKVYESSENRRWIALYNIDKGDEYKNGNSIEDAADCYELAAEWTINAMFLVVVTNKKDIIDKAWEALDEVVSRMESIVYSIGEERLSKIKNCNDAYKLIIDECE